MTTISTIEDLTSQWLSTTLGSNVTNFHLERIGTGQIGECYRTHLQYAAGKEGPTTVVLKIASQDKLSRQTGVSIGLFQREMAFYNDIAPRMKSAAIAPCYHASYDRDNGAFCLVLGDCSPAVVGDEIPGATFEQASIAVKALGKMLSDAQEVVTLESADWLYREPKLTQAYFEQLWGQYIERYGDRIKPEFRQVCEKIVSSFDLYQRRLKSPTMVQGLTHGDYRLDNMLFGQEGAPSPFTIVDWQTVTWGPAMTDLSYFLGCALTTEDRQRHEDELIRIYHAALGPKASFTFEQVREGVREESLSGLVMVIISPLLVQRTERGDNMFMIELERQCAHILDIKALDMLPDLVIRPPLRPNPTDEYVHPHTTEPLFNESWYFDFADPGQGIGAWIRLGLTPNQIGSWYTALVCGPNRPTVAIVDFEVPTPGADLTVKTDIIHATHVTEEPLTRYRCTVTGRAESHTDPSALLAGNPGRPVDVKLDLVWHTNGEPYAWRLATRYEIPCKVSGTITIDDETITITGAAGQRDHSWGPRDWWTSDWMWSALHLDDGTHIHAVHIRPHGHGRFCAGYIQGGGMPLTELTKVDAVEEIARNGLPLGTKVSIAPAPGDLSLDLKPLAHAPVRIVAKDGRVAMFPRLWVKVTTGDGRSGLGWIEWNLN